MAQRKRTLVIFASALFFLSAAAAIVVLGMIGVYGDGGQIGATPSSEMAFAVMICSGSIGLGLTIGAIVSACMGAIVDS